MIAAPAFAQGKGAANVSFGYANLETFGPGAAPNVNTPTGWNASVGVGVTPTAAFVGEVGGHYKDGGKLHTFQAGVRVNAASKSKTTPFFQVLTGLGHDNSGINANSWTLTPGGGVDAKINDQVAFRAQADWMLMRNSGVNINGLRFGAGIVINMPKK